MRWRTCHVSLLVLLAAKGVSAAQVGDEDAPASLEIHGFASQGYILSSHNNYLVDSSKGSFQFSEVGINFTKTLGDKLRLGIQLFANNLGPTGNFRANADWFYVDYRFADWLGLRAGRVKIPFGLYNEINDIDAARVPILLPQSVYPIQNRDYLLAQTGAELYGSIRSATAGALEYRVYGGTIFVDTPAANPAYQLLDFNVPYVFGGRLLWETPVDGLRIGGSVQTLRIDASLLENKTQVDVKIPASLWVGSAEYAAHDLLLAAEYSRWYVKSTSSNTALFPASSTVVSERAYAMANYRITTWFQPGVYYAILFPDTDHRSGRENVQHDIAFTFRYDLDTYWILKLEGHYMEGTASLSPTLNHDTPLASLQRDWGVFLVKTTGYF